MRGHGSTRQQSSQVSRSVREMALSRAEYREWAWGENLCEGSCLVSLLHSQALLREPASTTTVATSTSTSPTTTSSTRRLVFVMIHARGINWLQMDASSPVYTRSTRDTRHHPRPTAQLFRFPMQGNEEAWNGETQKLTDRIPGVILLRGGQQERKFLHPNMARLWAEHVHGYGAMGQASTDR